MAIKFAEDIIKEIQARGSIQVPEGYITGEAFEEWLRSEQIFIKLPDNIDVKKENKIKINFVVSNFFPENYGEAA